MARFIIDSIGFEGEGFGSECVIAFGSGSGSFRFGGGRVISQIVQLVVGTEGGSIELEGEYGAVICVSEAQKAEIERWANRYGTCCGY
ncbi:MAG: hypothetical protein WC505_04880 [Patescibacteria group bacterium]